MARSTLATIRTRLRRLVNDPSGASAVWSDDQLDEFLDRNRVEVRYQHLRPTETRAPNGGNITWQTFFADCGDWEDTPALVNSSYNPVSSSSADLLTGRWTTATDQNGFLPIMISGYTFDLYGASVAVLENWLATMRGSVDVSMDNLSKKNSQQIANLEALLEQYRQRAGQWSGVAQAQLGENGVGGGRLLQTDFNPWSKY